MRTKYAMPKHVAGILAGFLVFFSLSFCVYVNSPVKGSVTPANGASRAWLISKTDTANAPVIQGNFMITNVKPGNYMLMLEARPPFRDSFKQDVLVVEGQPTDVGVIEMHK
ncbi:MAG TPA: hypothetical protein VGI38_05110 [Puia sp.]|jgi:hypothetical protein